MEPLNPWLLYTSLAFSFLFLLSLARRRSPFKGRLPPGPRPLPLVGSLFELGDQPHRSFACLAKAYGPLMALRLGRVTTVVVSSHEIAKEVLQKNDAAFASRSVPDTSRAVGHAETSVAWLPPAQRWRGLRRVYNTHLFTSKRLDALQSLRREKIRELVRYVSSRSTAGLPVDIGRVAFTTMLNLISRTAFSVDLVDFNSESSQEFKDTVQRIMEEVGSPNISDFFPLLAAIDPQGRRRRLAALFKRLHDIFDQQIDRRLERAQVKDASKASGDFLDVLLEIKDQEDGFKLDRRTIKSLLTDLFVGGSDTSSSTVEWALAELLRSPESMAKAHDELRRVIGTEKEVEESDLSRLPYLQAVVKETLRLHPPAPFLLPRQPNATVELRGHVIPEGSRVLVNVWAMGRDGAVWADPNEFSPERFLDRDVDFRGRNFELIPFGAGRRICPGLPLAVRMVHLLLASLLQRFEWRLPEGMGPGDVDMREKFGITLSMAVPLVAMAVSVA